MPSLYWAFSSTPLWGSSHAWKGRQTTSQRRVAFVIDGYGHKTNGLPPPSRVWWRRHQRFSCSHLRHSAWITHFSNNTCCFPCTSFSLVYLQLCGFIFNSVICDFWEKTWWFWKICHICTHTPMYSHMYTHIAALLQNWFDKEQVWPRWEWQCCSTVVALHDVRTEVNQLHSIRTRHSWTTKLSLVHTNRPLLLI